MIFSENRYPLFGIMLEGSIAGLVGSGFADALQHRVTNRADVRVDALEVAQDGKMQ
jgi:hypothetical protein